MKKSNKGFSLVELIVVIAVMAVLVVVLAPTYLRYVDKSKLRRDISTIGEVIAAVEVVAVEESVYEEIPVKQVLSQQNRARATTFGWKTYLDIAANDGTITTRIELISGMEADDLQNKVREIVGSSVTFSNEILLAKGLEMRVQKDENGEVQVLVETYKYQGSEKDEEVKKALEEAFDTYSSSSLVTEEAYDVLLNGAQTAYSSAWQETYNDVYNSKYEELYGPAFDSANESDWDENVEGLAAYTDAYTAVTTKAYNDVYNAAKAAGKSDWRAVAAATAAAASKEVLSAADEAGTKASAEAKAKAEANAEENAKKYADEVAKAGATASATVAATQAGTEAAGAEIDKILQENPSYGDAFEEENRDITTEILNSLTQRN